MQKAGLAVATSKYVPYERLHVGCFCRPQEVSEESSQPEDTNISVGRYRYLFKHQSNDDGLIHQLLKFIIHEDHEFDAIRTHAFGELPWRGLGCQKLLPVVVQSRKEAGISVHQT